MAEPTHAPRPTSARRTAALALTFSGRATRMEVVSYILAVVLVQIAMGLIAMLVLTYDQRQALGDVLALLIALPVPALIARRCHDQGRSGHWAWLAVLVFVLWAARTVVARAWGIETRITVDQYLWPLDFAAAIASIATIALLFLPGTAGSNRFGSDPRGRE